VRGSTMRVLYDGDVHDVTLGCLNGDPVVELDIRIFVRSRAKWETIADVIPQYEISKHDESLSMARVQ